MAHMFRRHDFRGCAAFFSALLILSAHLCAAESPSPVPAPALAPASASPDNAASTVADTPPANIAPGAPRAAGASGIATAVPVRASTFPFPQGGGALPPVAAEGGALPSAGQIDDEVAGRLIRVVLVPRREAVLSAETSGKIVRIRHQLGGAFGEGEELLTLEDAFFIAAFDKAKATAKAAEMTLKSLQELRTRNDASLTEIENARRDVAAAQAEIALAKRNLSACHVVAPYAGRIADVVVNEYELVEPGKPFMRIIDDATLLGHVYLPGVLYPLAENGRSVPVRIVRGRSASATTGAEAARPLPVEETVQGTFCRVSPVIDPASGMFEAYVQIDNAGGRFRAGMEAWLKAEDLHGR